LGAQDMCLRPLPEGRPDGRATATSPFSMETAKSASGAAAAGTAGPAVGGMHEDILSVALGVGVGVTPPPI